MMKPVRFWVAAVVLASCGAAQAQTPPRPPTEAPTPGEELPRQPGTPARLLGGPLGQTEFGLEVGAGYSDNITRVDGDEETGEIATVGLDLRYQKATRRIEAYAAADLSYFEYLDDLYEGEVIGLADASLLLSIVPERFTWIFQDSFGQAQADPFTPVTPESRENVNDFSTGPELSLRLGSQNVLRLFGMYANTAYEESSFDADRITGGVTLARQPSATSEIALNVVTTETDFEVTGSRDYGRDSAFLSYLSGSGRTTLETRLGYNRLTPDGGESDGGFLGEIVIDRQLRPSSTLRLEAGQEFTTSGESLRTSLTSGSIGGVDVTATSDPFENTRVSLRWDFVRNRTGLSLAGSWNQDRYEQQVQLDRERTLWEATFTRRISPVLRFSLTGLFTEEQFDSSQLRSKEVIFLSRISRDLGRTLGLSLTLDRYQRRTSNDTGEYDETRAFLTLTYSPIGSSGGAR